MALYAFDGTGNEDIDTDGFESNVVKFFEAYDDPDKNDDPEGPRGSLYMRGVGRRARTFIGRGFSEAFGIGGHRRVRQALERLENNLEGGDAVVDICGFSRGAALAVSFGNEIASTMGGHVAIRFMGLFDVVGHFGLPGEHVNAGHNLRMPPNALRVCHAMALDETRVLFPLTRLSEAGQKPDSRLQEVWFRGTHPDVGGGNANTGLNWIALDWMFKNARRHGVSVSDDAIALNSLHQSEERRVGSIRDDSFVPRVVRDGDMVHVSVSMDSGFDGILGKITQPGGQPQLVDDLGNVIRTI